MVIKKLHMHNFGVYAGDNEFVFNSHKPVVLIGGMNGRGKTTFLEAVLLALYGSNSFAYTESGRKSYSQYLRSFINRNADDNICKVELEFEINNTIKENYVVRREWDALNKRTREHIYVYKDGMFNEFLTANWPMFVENILPSALSSFFFFDGEKIAELAVDSTNIQLKNSIRSMLGISVLDVLSSDILRNLKRITRAENKIRTMENQIIDDKIKIADLEQRYSEAVSKMNSATSELNKQVETYLSIAELKDKADRTKRYSNIALKIIERYEIELQKRKIDVLAETITNCYTKLANKKNLIKTIVMDPETLDLKYLSEEGIEIPKDSLSAGEQQLMVISILWALAICSKKKLPVIIDTPLSRLDSLHRTALITTYFPNAGEQTIILSTDSEIDENYYELMRENVGDEFTLKYDEDSKSTSIERGYLIGAKL